MNILDKIIEHKRKEVEEMRAPSNEYGIFYPLLQGDN